MLGPVDKDRSVSLKVEFRDFSGILSVYCSNQCTATQFDRTGIADKTEYAAINRTGTNIVRHFIQDSEHTDCRRRHHGNFSRFIVKTDIATRHGSIELLASFTHSGTSFFEIVVGFRFVRIAEIETIGDGDWFGTDAGDIQRPFSNGMSSAPERIDRRFERRR